MYRPPHAAQPTDPVCGPGRGWAACSTCPHSTACVACDRGKLDSAGHAPRRCPMTIGRLWAVVAAVVLAYMTVLITTLAILDRNASPSRTVSPQAASEPVPSFDLG